MRWFLSPLIGDGTATIDPDNPETTGPYRAKASDYGAHTVIIPGNEDGTPKFSWCIGRFDGDPAGPIADDPDITLFPALGLDDVLTANQRTWLINKISALGKPTGWITAGITVRQCVRTIGRYLEENFDIEWLGVRG